MSNPTIESLLQAYAKVTNWDTYSARLNHKTNTVSVQQKPGFLRRMFTCGGPTENKFTIIKEGELLTSMINKFQETSTLENDKQFDLIAKVVNAYNCHIGRFNEKLGAITTDKKIDVDSLLSKKLKDFKAESEKASESPALLKEIEEEKETLTGTLFEEPANTAPQTAAPAPAEAATVAAVTPGTAKAEDVRPAFSIDPVVVKTAETIAATNTPAAPALTTAPGALALDPASARAVQLADKVLELIRARRAHKPELIASKV